MLSNNRHNYGSVTQVLHWATAAMIIGQYVLAKLAERAEDTGSALTQLALLANHKSLGMSILILAIIRVSWRLTKPPPQPPKETPHWQNKVASIMHWLLYLLIFALPVTGWLMSSASAYSVSWFNLFTFPDLVGPDELLKDQFHEIHHFLGEALFILALVHILAAFKHHFYDKDTILKGMLSITSFGVFLGLLSSILFALTTVSAPSVSSPATFTTPATNEHPATEVPEKNLNITSKPTQEVPLWVIDYSASELSFSAVQAGADFTGVWQSWTAEVRFDPANLSSSTARVEITIKSINTNDEDRDTTLMDSDWFDQSVHPFASYAVSEFAELSEGIYTAQGLLNIKEVNTEVPFEFTLSPDGQLLTGEARLDRIELQIGTGEWLDTTWVEADVLVSVKLVRMQ